MIYADLPAGATAFVDASVFIHHFEPNAVFLAAARRARESRMTRPSRYTESSRNDRKLRGL